MASVYILYSSRLNKYYVGSCISLESRIEEHKTKKYSNSFTSKTDDWILFFSTENLHFRQARKIEKHIKRMKSSKYIENLKRYPEIVLKLTELYAERV